MKKSKVEYYLGLDLGTSSVGWAVTDANYNLLKVKGKDLWGIREFEEALTSVDRRTHRISRRTRQREQIRMGLLKDYFHDAIMEVDKNFYLRLDNSKYYLEDKDDDVKSKNAIFDDENFKDKDYYKKYPTIFHLRKALINNECQMDVRFVYLALLNMFKHRGHFLNAELSSDIEGKLIDAYRTFCENLKEQTDICFPELNDVQQIEDILGNRDYSRTKKLEELIELLQIDKKDKKKIFFIKAICGLKVNIINLFDDLIIEDDKKIEIYFADSGYDDKKQEIEDVLGNEYFQIIESMKAVYDIGSLASIMKGYTFLSEARVAEYDKHAVDLKLLKRVIRKYHTKEVYDEFLRTDKAGSYSAYVNSLNSEKKIRRNMSDRKQESLYKTIKSILKDLPQEDEDIKYIVDEISKETFLPKQLTASNGVIPNQVHLKEMKTILKNAEGYLSFLLEKDEYGLTVSERILQLFSFHLPYYVGPTSEKSAEMKGNGWVIRKAGGMVFPWNINEKIDLKKTSEEFITRMVRRCTYINGERVLPKASMEYESFCVLNEINNIRINGERIENSLKQNIYCDLFKKGKKVTRKQLVNYLIAQGIVEDDTQISGIDITINSSLSTYGKFKAIFGEHIEEDKYKNMIEDIVFWCTVYGDSKKFLKEQIEEKYKDELTSDQIKRIMGFKFKDWGNLSKEFLEMSGCDKSIGEQMSLIRMMWETNMNLMEILHSDNYTYMEELESRQTVAFKLLSDVEAEDLDDFYFSAPVKRMMWQTILIIKELNKVLGASPKRIFIEMTRKPDDIKQRTISRKQKFIDLYKSLKNESRDWKGIIETAEENGTIKSKKMYLYLTQKGRCMYTGKTIELEDLFNDNLYDIDHIYPRHYVKDDNIDNNLVLVCKDKNAHKSDDYPLEETIYKSQISMWKELYRNKFINEEKYNRLTGRNKLTDEQKAGFIARQLVETSQGTKGVSELLKKILPETEIVYSKASNVSEFRQLRKIVKCRSINDFHHAHDAYLNIVVGNVYYVKFTKNPWLFIKSEYNKDKKKNHYNLSRMFDWDVKRGEEIAWIAQKEDGNSGTIKTVKSMLAKNTPLMTRMNFEGHGEIADLNPISAKNSKDGIQIPLKSSDNKIQDVARYGGYNKVSIAYFFLVEHDVKKKRIRTLETVPIYMTSKIEDNNDELTKYCIEQLKLINPSIKVSKIKIQSLIKKDGYFMNISGKALKQIEVRNAVNMCLNEEWVSYIKKLEKYEIGNVISDDIKKEKNIELYNIFVNKHKNSIYAKRPNPVGEKLTKAKSKFEDLDIEKQIVILNQILKLSAIGLTKADLTLVGEGASVGTMKISNSLNNSNEFILINQSVTGIYESRIDLLTV